MKIEDDHWDAWMTEDDYLSFESEIDWLRMMVKDSPIPGITRSIERQIREMEADIQ